MVKPTTGFTLIELVMVIVLVGILAVVAAPRLGDKAVYDLDRATHDLIEAIRYAQEQSMVHSGALPYQIAITTSGFTVTQSGTSIPNPLDGSASYSNNTTEWTGISISAAQTISFNSRGAPTCTTACSTPGDASVTLTLTKSGNNTSLTIEKFTGYAYRN